VLGLLGELERTSNEGYDRSRLEFLSIVPSALPYAVEATASTLIFDDHRVVTQFVASVCSLMTGHLARQYQTVHHYDFAEAAIQRCVFR
jgi:hypothetical protein